MQSAAQTPPVANGQPPPEPPTPVNRIGAPASEPEKERDVVIGAALAAYDRAKWAGRAAAWQVGAAAQPVVAKIKCVTANQAKGWLVLALVLPFLFMTYTFISSDGLRTLFDALAVPLHKSFPALARWKELRALDRATIFSVVMLIVSWNAWRKVVRIYVRPPELLTNREKLLWVVGVGFLAFDAITFFLGLHASGGFLLGTAGSYFAALVGTGMYVCLLVFVAYWLDDLEHPEGDTR